MAKKFTLTTVSVLIAVGVVATLLWGIPKPTDAQPVDSQETLVKANPTTPAEPAEPAQPAAAVETRSEQLVVGSKAPALNIQHWVSDGGGEYPHTTDFKPGQIYVVEFWATWCGPCLKAMPHLAELQERYKAKVQLISVTNESLVEVADLMSQDYPNSNRTFGQITGAYSLTADPDGSTHEDYMEAAGINSVPSAFVVGPSGEIEFMGHAGRIDGVLEKLVDGTWDRDAYYAAQEKREAILNEIDAAVDAEDIGKAFRASLRLNELTEPDGLMQVKFMQNQLAIRVGDEKAQQFFVDTAEELKGEDGAVAALAWMVVQMKREGEEPSAGILKTAEETLTKRISELKTPDADREKNKGMVMDILSHLYYVQGKLDQAIANQEAAVKFNNDDELTDFLKQMKQEKADQ